MCAAPAGSRDKPASPATASSCSDPSSPSDRLSISLGYSSRMDSRAKQRLTGAVILVALFVLLVPELLTGPKNPPSGAGAPADEGLRRYTIDLDAPGANGTPASG